MSENIVKYESNGLNKEQKELIKSTIAKKASDTELAMFFEICKMTGLNPFTKQIYLMPFWDDEAKKYSHAVVTGIDGLRSLAMDTGEYDGQSEPIWIDKDGREYRVWTLNENPYACKISVYKKGVKNPTVGIAYFDMYAKTKQDKNTGKYFYTGFWSKPSKAAHMIAKCAEALALRKAFPAKLSGIHIEEEFDGATKTGSKYETGITTQTDNEIREYLTDNEIHEEIKQTGNTFTQMVLEQNIIPTDENTAKKVISDIRNTLHENSKEIDEMVNDLLNTNVRFSLLCSDEELSRFKSMYENKEYSRKKLLTLYNTLIERENEQFQKLNQYTNEENERFFAQKY